MDMQKGVSLKKYTTYHIGGKAKFFLNAKTAQEVKEGILFANENHLQIFILGGGSNVLISDRGFDGVVIHIDIKGISIDDKEHVQVGAGASIKELLDQSIEAGLAGLEWAGGLPGSVGGAVFGNAGCFGSEIKDTIEHVIALNHKTQHVKHYSRPDCLFAYRTSRFKEEGHYTIIEVRMKLARGNKAQLRKVADEKIAHRQMRHPLEYPNSGSIFKNISDKNTVKKILSHFPELENDVRERWYGKIPAAILIEKVGLRGKTKGGAQVSEKHANFIVNKGNASAHDVAFLVKRIKDTIEKQLNITLEEELRYVGFQA